MLKASTIIGCAALAVLTATPLPPQPTQIPKWWFTADPKLVLADPLFSDLPLSTRKELPAQIDPKFAKMKAEKRDALLWRAETSSLPKAADTKQVFIWNPSDPRSASELLDFGQSSPSFSQTIESAGLRVKASIERVAFFRCHIRIAK